MKDRTGKVRDELHPDGSVQIGGELWSAESEHGGIIPEGIRVRVVSVKGLKLIVTPEKSIDGDKK
jgi:membrane-bound ClpP family serine protease